MSRVGGQTLKPWRLSEHTIDLWIYLDHNSVLFPDNKCAAERKKRRIVCQLNICVVKLSECVVAQSGWSHDLGKANRSQLIFAAIEDECPPPPPPPNWIRFGFLDVTLLTLEGVCLHRFSCDVTEGKLRRDAEVVVCQCVIVSSLFVAQIQGGDGRGSASSRVLFSQGKIYIYKKKNTNYNKILIVIKMWIWSFSGR